MLRINKLTFFLLGLAITLPHPGLRAESNANSSLQNKLAQATQLAMADHRDDARDLLKKITVEYPDSPEAYNNLAVLAAYSENWSGAIELLKRALATNQSLKTSYQNLNLIYRHQAALAYRAALPDEDEEPLALPDLTMITLTPVTPVVQPGATDTESAVDSVAKEEVTSALQRWAAAWSAQDIDAYIDSYIDNYAPDTSTDHNTWRKVRRERLLTPSSIAVSIENTEVERLSKHRALVTFIQNYRSNTFSDSVKKLVFMQRREGIWSIAREHTIQ